ncbi:hypothetical protein [Pseudooceanicola batsensis]|uniref:hypothetical protein n=1 Tax=Pseudooceanicola batsensis TaxID=314255 RepID=UPI0011D1BD0E|nr:hypothetical protein [Pseudooceanicola batsensis]
MAQDRPHEGRRPGFATGQEMHARLARSGPPLDITTQGLPKRRQPRMDIDTALSRPKKSTDPNKS